ncbi:adenosine kinase [Aliikangiella sp. IMCC44632]
MTSKYQVYGIGNALVDFEIETTAEELASLEVEKGVMTLIEEERQGELFMAFKGKQHSRACGGSAANTIIGAQSLGAQCFYSCKVANDETGHFYRDDLLNHGVASNLASEALSDGKTGKCLVLITPDADRTMNTFLGITGDINANQLDKEALLQSEYVYVEGYLASSPSALSAVDAAKDMIKNTSTKMAVSLSDPNMVKFCRAGLDQIIGDGVEIIFANYDEATLFTQMSNLQDALNELLKFATTVVVTLGPKGAVVATKQQLIEITGHTVEAIDTNGAGDLFAGSFLYALTHGFSLQQAGQIASYASSLLVTQFGPRLNAEGVAKVKSYIQSLT